MLIYLAGPSYSLAERMFNQDLAAALELSLLALQVPRPRVVGPQNRPGDAASNVHRQASSRPFVANAVLSQCDAVVAIFDGADADAGTCVEIGYAGGKGKPIIGIRSDFRQGEDQGLNLMVSNICTTLLVRHCTTVSMEDLVDEVASFLAAHVRAAAIASA